MSTPSTTPDPDLPFEGEDPPKGSVPVPQRYEAANPDSSALESAEERDSRTDSLSPTEKRIMAVASPVALIAFILCGFAFGGWYWAWVFFLVPGILYKWFTAND